MITTREGRSGCASAGDTSAAIAASETIDAPISIRQRDMSSPLGNVR
jgi:hypothetical protein